MPRAASLRRALPCRWRWPHAADRRRSGGRRSGHRRPARRAVYLEATVARRASCARTRSPPPGRCCRPTTRGAGSASWLDRRSAEAGEPSSTTSADIEPWLGERAGAVADRRWRGRPRRGRGDRRDRPTGEAAQGAIDEAQGERPTAGPSARTRACDYEVDAGRRRGRRVDELRAGRPGGRAQARRSTRSSGESLADADRYKRRRGRARGDRLGALLHGPGAVRARRRGRAGRRRSSLRQIQQLVAVREAGAGGGRVRGQRRPARARRARSSAEGSKSLGALGEPRGGGARRCLKELPGDTWGARRAEVGETLRAASTRSRGALGGAASSSQLREQLGIDLERRRVQLDRRRRVLRARRPHRTLDGGAVIRSPTRRGGDAASASSSGCCVRGRVDAQPIDDRGRRHRVRGPAADAPKPIVSRAAATVVIAYGDEAAAVGALPGQLGDARALRRGDGRARDDVEPGAPGLDAGGGRARRRDRRGGRRVRAGASRTWRRST